MLSYWPSNLIIYQSFMFIEAKLSGQDGLIFREGKIYRFFNVNQKLVNEQILL